MEVYEIQDLFEFLRGKGEFNIKEFAAKNPETLARALVYFLDKKFHRRNYCKALLSLLTYAPPKYREIAWAIIQKVPLSILLHVVDVIEKRENTRRLRNALVYKIVNSTEKEILRAFLISPKRFRKLFKLLKLPTKYFEGEEITNKNYLFAVSLLNKSLRKLSDEIGIEKMLELGIPFHNVVNLAKNVEDVEKIAEKLSPGEFLRHSRWFRSILGDDRFFKVVRKKVEKAKDLMSLLFIKDHLTKTGAISNEILNFIEEKVKKEIERIISESNIESFALIVDVSGSMEAAKEITRKLYEALSLAGKKIKYLIAFNNIAFEITPERLKEIPTSGMTSIGSAFLLLKKKLENDSVDAIILISDMEENTPPFLDNVLKLYDKKIPLIILHCGRKRYSLDYPHSVIYIRDFHPKLLLDIFREIVKLVQKSIEEKEVTEVLTERRPLDEELNFVELPERPKETLKKGFFKKLLCG